MLCLLNVHLSIHEYTFNNLKRMLSIPLILPFFWGDLQVTTEYVNFLIFANDAQHTLKIR